MHANTIIAPFKLDYKLKRLLLAVGVIALFFRLIFIIDMLGHKSSAEIETMTPDGIGYVHLAKNIAHENIYAQPQIQSRKWALKRTPGYPFFYAIFEYLSVAPKGVIIAQALIGVCIPLFVTVLVYLTLQSALASFVAGSFSALSPTGIGLSGIILVDHLFASVFITGFFLLYIGISYARTSYIYWAGVVFGIGALIKPILVLWPVYSVVVCYFFARAAQQKIPWKPLCLYALIPVLIMVGWGTRNYAAEGMFTPSVIGAMALRCCLATKVEVLANENDKKYNRHDKALRNKFVQNIKNLNQRIEEDFNSGTAFPLLYKQQLDESLAIFKDHPLTTVRVYFINIWENMTRRFEYFSHQLPNRSLIHRLMSYNNYLTIKSANLVYITIAIYFISFLIPYGRLPRETLIRRFYISLSFFLTFFYFAFLSGTTHWSGPRVLYPVEFTLAILFTFAFYTLYERLGVSRNPSPEKRKSCQ